MAAEVGKSKFPKIDMTPMVDLGFLLLTFFILTTSMTDFKVMEVVKPPIIETTIKAPPVPASRCMTIILDKENEVFWYQGVDQPELHLTNFSKTGGIRDAIIHNIQKLRDNPKFNDKSMMFLIKFSDKSNYKNMVDIIDEMSVMSQKHYAIVDLTKDEIEMIDEYRKQKGINQNN